MRSDTSPIPSKILAAYGAGSIGTGIFSTVPGLVLLYYLTETLGLPAIVAGLAIFLPKLWDLVTDPLIGLLSDRTRSRRGRRRPWLLFGSLLLPVCFVLIFSPPSGGESWTFAYVLVSFLLAATAYTIFAVPYIAMPSEMTSNYHERNRVQSWRIAFTVCGVLIGGMTPVLVQTFGGGSAGYLGMSIVVALIIALSFFIAYRGTAGLKLRNSENPQPQRLKSILTRVFSHRDFRLLASAYTVQISGFSIYAATLPYAVAWQLSRDSDTVSMIFITLNLIAMASLRGWTSIARLFGKTDATLVACSLLVVAYLGFWQAGTDTPSIHLIILAAVAGIGFGGQQMLMFSMLTDTLHGEDFSSSAGMFSGIWTGVEKLGMALGAFLASIALQMSGFESGGASTPAADTVAAIAHLHGLIPAVVIVLGAFALIFYRQSDRRAAYGATD